MPAGCIFGLWTEVKSIYDWKVMEKDHFRWWKKRIRAAGSMYDVVRIDHFIGIVRYYAIPADGVPVDGAFREDREQS